MVLGLGSDLGTGLRTSKDPEHIGVSSYLFGGPYCIIRTIVFWGVYWGPLTLGNHHISLAQWVTTFITNQKGQEPHTHMGAVLNSFC